MMNRRVREFVNPIRNSEEIWKEFPKTIQKDCTIDTMVSTFLEWNKTMEGGEICLNVYVPQIIGNKKTDKIIKLCGITVQAIWHDWRICDYIMHYDIIGGKEFVHNNIISRIPCKDVQNVLRKISIKIKRNYNDIGWRKSIAQSYTSDERKYLYNNGEFCEYNTTYNVHLEDRLTSFCKFVKEAIKVKGDIKKANTDMLDNIYNEPGITSKRREKIIKKYVDSVYDTVAYINSLDKEVLDNLDKMMDSNTNAYIFLNAAVFNRKSYVYQYDDDVDRKTFSKFTNHLHLLSCRYGVRNLLRKGFLCTGECTTKEIYVKPENEKKM